MQGRAGSRDAGGSRKLLAKGKRPTARREPRGGQRLSTFILGRPLNRQHTEHVHVFLPIGLGRRRDPHSSEDDLQVEPSCPLQARCTSTMGKLGPGTSYRQAAQQDAQRTEAEPGPERRAAARTGPGDAKLPGTDPRASASPLPTLATLQDFFSQRMELQKPELLSEGIPEALDAGRMR